MNFAKNEMLFCEDRRIMHKMTYLSRFDVFCVFCGKSHLMITTRPHLAALNSTYLTHNYYENHTTLIGFTAAYKDPPF